MHDLFKSLFDWYNHSLATGGYPLIVLLMAIGELDHAVAQRTHHSSRHHRCAEDRQHDFSGHRYCGRPWFMDRGHRDVLGRPLGWPAAGLEVQRGPGALVGNAPCPPALSPQIYLPPPGNSGKNRESRTLVEPVRQFRYFRITPASRRSPSYWNSCGHRAAQLRQIFDLHSGGFRALVHGSRLGWRQSGSRRCAHGAANCVRF